MGTRKKHRLLDQLEESKITSEEQVAVLRKLAADRAADIRCRAAEQLCIPGSAEAEVILLQLLDDKNDMVRVNASDSISACGSREALEPLKQRTKNDTCFMVRGYAACSAAEIALRTGAADDELTAFLMQALESEKDEWVRANLFATLYELGRDDYLPQLITALDSNEYQVRCAAVNLLAQTGKEKDIPLVREALVRRREKEDSENLAVISTIDRCLQEMDGGHE